jgi:hypothetical protein
VGEACGEAIMKKQDLRPVHRPSAQSFDYRHAKTTQIFFTDIKMCCYRHGSTECDSDRRFHAATVTGSAALLETTRVS